MSTSNPEEKKTEKEVVADVMELLFSRYPEVGCLARIMMSQERDKYVEETKEKIMNYLRESNLSTLYNSVMKYRIQTNVLPGVQAFRNSKGLISVEESFTYFDLFYKNNMTSGVEEVIGDESRVIVFSRILCMALTLYFAGEYYFHVTPEVLSHYNFFLENITKIFKYLKLGHTQALELTETEKKRSYCNTKSSSALNINGVISDFLENSLKSYDTNLSNIIEDVEVNSINIENNFRELKEDIGRFHNSQKPDILELLENNTALRDRVIKYYNLKEVQ